MKTSYFVLMIPVLFFSVTALSAPLGKYSDPEATIVPRQTAPPAIFKQQLNAKMQEAIERLNGMSPEERTKWINYYVLKMEEAQKKGNYLESGYYSGILAGVK